MIPNSHRLTLHRLQFQHRPKDKSPTIPDCPQMKLPMLFNHALAQYDPLTREVLSDCGGVVPFSRKTRNGTSAIES